MASPTRLPDIPMGTFQMKSALALALVLIVAASASARTSSAIAHDPPVDRAAPASSMAVRIESHGQLMNGVVYLPAGSGPHPVVVLLHGFPGNEQNLDLAQAMRRAGWAVVTFHYRGTWGSGGAFSFDGAVEDGAAVLAWVRDPARAKQLQAKRIAVVGHSMGGYVAAELCAAHPELVGCVLIAPWDLSADQPLLAAQSAVERDRTAATEFDDIDGRISGMSAREVVEALATQGGKWSLQKTAPGLARLRTLVVIASRDADDCKAISLLPALKQHGAKALRVETVETDHSFNDRRIALEGLVLNWLEELPVK